MGDKPDAATIQPWSLSHRADPVARELADRHYNRQKIGSPQFVPPGRCIVLLTSDARAFWVTSWPFAEYVRHAWPGAWVCSAFRSEGAGVASSLIVNAVAATRFAYGDPPELGMISFIDRSKVRPTMVRGRPVWGWTWRRAGFVDAGETKGGLLAPCAYRRKLCQHRAPRFRAAWRACHYSPSNPATSTPPLPRKETQMVDYSELVKQLRAMFDGYGAAKEAADAIEALTADRDNLQDMFDAAAQAHEELTAQCRKIIIEQSRTAQAVAYLEVLAIKSLTAERDAALADVAMLREAAFVGRSALDQLMGDSDIDDDDSPEFKACQLLSKVLSTTTPKKDQS